MKLCQVVHAHIPLQWLKMYQNPHFFFSLNIVVSVGNGFHIDCNVLNKQAKNLNHSYTPSELIYMLSQFKMFVIV